MNEFASSMQMLALLGAGATGGLVILKVVLSAYRLAKQIEAVHDAVLSELLPNDGNSLIDRVEAIEDDFITYQQCQSDRWSDLYDRLDIRNDMRFRDA